MKVERCRHCRRELYYRPEHDGLSCCCEGAESERIQDKAA